LFGVQATAASGGCFASLALWTALLATGRLYSPALLLAQAAIIAVYPVAITAVGLIVGLLRLRDWARITIIVLTLVVGLLTPVVFSIVAAIWLGVVSYATFLPYIALLLPVAIVGLLVGRQQRLLFSTPPPSEDGPSREVAHRRVRRWIALAVLPVPILVALPVLNAMTFRHEYTYAEVRAMPEAQLRYPGATVTGVSGNGYASGGLDAPTMPAMVLTDFTTRAPLSAVLRWYQNRLTQLGWHYAGCVTGTTVEQNSYLSVGPYVFGRGADSLYEIWLGPPQSSLQTALTLQTRSLQGRTLDGEPLSEGCI
jgi:hypothetical protein